MNDHVLAKFQVVRILSNNTNRKTAVLLGTFDDAQDEESRAIVVLEKKAFVAEDFSKDGQYISQIVRTEEQFVNDIYGNYEIVPGEKLNSKFG